MQGYDVRTKKVSAHTQCISCFREGASPFVHLSGVEEMLCAKCAARETLSEAALENLHDSLWPAIEHWAQRWNPAGCSADQLSGVLMSYGATWRSDADEGDEGEDPAWKAVETALSGSQTQPHQSAYLVGDRVTVTNTKKGRRFRANLLGRECVVTHVYPDGDVRVGLAGSASGAGEESGYGSPANLVPAPQPGKSKALPSQEEWRAEGRKGA